MSYGYWDKILRVDLTTGSVSSEFVSNDIWRQIIGGVGLGGKILLEETPPKIDPLSPDNRLIFAIGPFQSLPFPGNAKWSVITKSPLTGTFLDAAAGAKFGPTLKGTGYDAVVVQGKSPKPVYLLITEDSAEIRDASKFWGMDSEETAKGIRAEIGKQLASVVTIGPSGERLVPIACIVADGHSFAGRGGAGAVMGSKNLKAIAVFGSKKVQMFDGDKANNLTKEIFKQLARDGAEFRKTGTPGSFIASEVIGDAPIKYWTEDEWHEDALLIGTPRYNEILNVTPLPCMNCPLGCHRHIKVQISESDLLEGSGPEYETLGMMGSCCKVNDLIAIAKANDICNRLGIDTISAGAYIAFLMECYEKGLVTETDAGGLELKWGDGDVLVELTKQIALGEGLGKLFDKGIVGAAGKIGNGAEELIAHVKNMDIPAHDPRAIFDLYVNYAVATRGACHERGDIEDLAFGLAYPELGMPTPPDRFSTDSYVVKVFQDTCVIYNSLVICNFMVASSSLKLNQIMTVFNDITGFNWNLSDLMNAGERIFTMQRLINVRDGLSRKDDTIPKKFFKAAESGGRAGKALDPQSFNEALEDYYKLRGWDENGIPKKDTLDKLGLGNYADIIK